jgi:hypothetical protein
MNLNRRTIETLRRWVEDGIALIVPVVAAVVLVLSTVYTFRVETLLQLILAVVAGLAISEGLIRFGTLNDIAVHAKQLGTSNLELLRSAQEAGIVSLSSRADESRTRDIVNEVQRSQGILDLCGVALPSLVENDFVRNVLLKYSQQYDVRVLLLDPECDEARRRADIEKPLGRKTIADIHDTLDWLRTQQARNRRFRVHLYNLPPMLSLFITNNFAFVEPYHFGRPDGLEGCIGGKVPMMKIRNRRELGTQNQYGFFKAHFEYMWRLTHGLQVHLPIEIIEARASEYVVLENHMDNDISMDEWKLISKGSNSPYLFGSDFVWKGKSRICVSSRDTPTPAGEWTLLEAEPDFLGNNTILTVSNAAGTVVWEMSLPPGG